MVLQLLGDDGRLLGSATAEHADFRSPRTAWAEQDPVDWWRASREAIRAVLDAADVDGSAVKCIGLSGQMHGAVLLDDGGAVLRPSIIWCDQRTEEECRWLEERVGRDRLLQLTS